MGHGRRSTEEFCIAHIESPIVGVCSTQVDLRANVLRFTNLDIALPFLQGSDLPPAARMLAEEGITLGHCATVALSATRLPST